MVRSLVELPVAAQSGWAWLSWSEFQTAWARTFTNTPALPSFNLENDFKMPGEDYPGKCDSFYPPFPAFSVPKNEMVTEGAYEVPFTAISVQTFSMSVFQNYLSFIELMVHFFNISMLSCTMVLYLSTASFSTNPYHTHGRLGLFLAV